MSTNKNKSDRTVIAVLLLLSLTLWWALQGFTEGPANGRFFGDFPSIYGVMALWGTVCGVAIAKGWGLLKSVMGRSIIMFSLGLLAQEFGQIVYAYMAFFKKIEVPYPSIGDIGYFGSIPFYIYGVFLLGKASGMHIKLRSFINKIYSVVIPIIILSVGYLLFLKGYTVDWSEPIKVLLDFGYPLGQAIYISITILIYIFSRGILGGIMKNKILFLLAALCMQFLADYTFLYQVSRGMWMVGGINDYMYLVAYFLMTFALLRFHVALIKTDHA